MDATEQKPGQQVAMEDDEDLNERLDLSLITTMRIKQEKRNLDLILRKLDRQRRKCLDFYQNEREQTVLYLEKQVKHRSTALSELLEHTGKKESIAISRRESLNVIRGHAGCIWNVANMTYVIKPSVLTSHDSQDWKLPQSVNTRHRHGLKMHANASNDDDVTFGGEKEIPASSKSEKLNTFPFQTKCLNSNEKQKVVHNFQKERFVLPSLVQNKKVTH